MIRRGRRFATGTALATLLLATACGQGSTSGPGEDAPAAQATTTDPVRTTGGPTSGTEASTAEDEAVTVAWR